MRSTARLLTGAALAAASLGLMTASATGAFADAGDAGGGDFGGTEAGAGEVPGGEIPDVPDEERLGGEVPGGEHGDVGPGGGDWGGDHGDGDQGGDQWGGGDHGGGKPGVLEVTPASAPPGATVTVNTTACGPGGYAKGDARELGAGEFELKAETHKEVVVGHFTVPDGARPGTYRIVAKCKNGKEADGDVTVRAHSGPVGHVKTGVGGSVGPDTTQIAAGTAVLAAAAVGGTLLLRRRASGTQED
ncbi:hypothetical protein [Streptomyces sp. NBC_00370]|uniref:hypothetical protein n=1 Tax=Streptomyces sp. NBC_00370 TaxID=2975728 RepID=UPI003FA68E96